MERLNINQQKQHDLEIFRATSEDFDTLTDISRVCFPNQMRWKGPKSHSRKWWDLLINSENCKIWACSSQGQVIGYTTLVIDRTKYEDAWEKHRPNLLATLYLFATCPKQSIKRAFKKLEQYRIKNLPKPPDPHTKNSQINSYEKMRRIIAENTPWCGPSAVVPSMRGKGVATEINKFCLQRAMKLGYNEIYACLKRSNIKSKGLVEKLGFVTIEEVDHVLFCKKTLETK